MHGKLRRGEPKNIDPAQNDWIGGFVLDGNLLDVGQDTAQEFSKVETAMIPMVAEARAKERRAAESAAWSARGVIEVHDRLRIA